MRYRFLIWDGNSCARIIVRICGAPHGEAAIDSFSQQELYFGVGEEYPVQLSQSPLLASLT
jgi:hypothetical protein